MRILTILPISDDRFNRRVELQIARYLDSRGHTTRVENLDRGPIFIDSASAEEEAAQEIIKRCLHVNEHEFDAIFVNCFGDPGVEAARKFLRLPIVGGSEPAIALAASMSDEFAVVVPTDDLSNHLHERLNRRGYNAHLFSLESIPKAITEPLDRLEFVLKEIFKVRPRHEPVVLGCTAWAHLAEDLKKSFKDETEVKIIEPQTTAINYLISPWR